MKRQSLVLLAVAFVAAAAGCFKDPVSDLQKGPKYISMDHQYVFLATGDSVSVVATLKDGYGDALPATGATWTSSDPAVAVVRLDTTFVPGNYFTRGIIRATGATGAVTNVVVATRGISDTVVVTVE